MSVFLTGMTKQERLPAAERDVLACLSRLESGTVREIQEALKPVRPMEPASILTLLKRLEGKGLVSKEKAPTGKAFVFKPTDASGKAYKNMMSDLFQRVFGGDTMAFMASFFETRKPTEDEIDQMQTLLTELREEKKKKGAKK